MDHSCQSEALLRCSTSSPIYINLQRDALRRRNAMLYVIAHLRHRPSTTTSHPSCSPVHAHSSSSYVVLVPILTHLFVIFTVFFHLACSTCTILHLHTRLVHSNAYLLSCPWGRRRFSCFFCHFSPVHGGRRRILFYFSYFSPIHGGGRRISFYFCHFSPVLGGGRRILFYFRYFSPVLGGGRCILFYFRYFSPVLGGGRCILFYFRYFSPVHGGGRRISFYFSYFSPVLGGGAPSELLASLPGPVYTVHAIRVWSVEPAVYNPHLLHLCQLL